MSRYSEFFLAGPSSTVKYETLTISHPSFPQTYYLVRNAYPSLDALDETSMLRTYTHVPMSIKQSSQEVNLDFGIVVTMGNFQGIIDVNLEDLAESWSVKPTVEYRAYSSDDITEPILGPFVLEVTEFAFNSSTCEFTCTPPAVNRNKTGITYTVGRFPTLRGFVV